MSEIPPAPNPYPYPTPPQPTPPDTPLIPSWLYPVCIMLLIAGVIIVLVAVYLTHKSLAKNGENKSDMKNNKASAMDPNNIT